jgi:hypothetical protein
LVFTNFGCAIGITPPVEFFSLGWWNPTSCCDLEKKNSGMMQALPAACRGATDVPEGGGGAVKKAGF